MPWRCHNLNSSKCISLRTCCFLFWPNVFVEKTRRRKMSTKYLLFDFRQWNFTWKAERMPNIFTKVAATNCDSMKKAIKLTDWIVNSEMVLFVLKILTAEKCFLLKKSRSWKCESWMKELACLFLMGMNKKNYSKILFIAVNKRVCGVYSTANRQPEL